MAAQRRVQQVRRRMGAAQPGPAQLVDAHVEHGTDPQRPALEPADMHEQVAEQLAGVADDEADIAAGDAAGVALLAAGAMVALVGQNPMEVIRVLIDGAFGSQRGLSYTLYYTTTFIFTGLAVSVGIVVYHYTLIRERDRPSCFKAFLHNNWVGAAIFAGWVLDYWLR